jgi:hypothetical protein
MLRQSQANHQPDQDCPRLEDYPSLRRYLEENLQEIYRQAVKLALIETELEHRAIADECPWNLDILLKEAIYD